MAYKSTKKLSDHKQYKGNSDFEDLLEEARMAADSDVAEDFVKSLIEKHEKWGTSMFLSDKQLEWLLKIAEWDD